MREVSHVWQVDGNPADIVRRDGIGMPSEPARYTKKSGLVGPISLIHTAAGRAGAASVSGVYQDHGHSRQSRFVGDFLPEIEESPGVQSVPLAASNRYPRANALEVLQGNGPLCVLRLEHYALCNHVVGVTGESTLSTRTFLEKSSGRSGPFLLELVAQPAMSAAQVIEVRATVNLPIGVSGNVNYSQVNSQDSLNLDRVRLLHIAGGEEVEVPLDVAEIRLSLLGGEERAMVVPSEKCNSLSAGSGPNAHGRGRKLPRQHSLVIGNGPERFEFPIALSIQLVGIGHFSDSPHDYLGREGEAFFEGVVEPLVNVELAQDFVLPCPGAGKVSRSVELTYGRQKSLPLLRRGGEFDFSCQFHKENYSIVSSIEQEGMVPLPRLKNVGFRAGEVL